MNTTMRPPGPVGVALLRNKDLREHVDIQDGERTGSRMSLVHSTHLQPVPFPQGCWAVGAWMGLVPSHSSCLVSDPGCSAGKRWREEENSVARDGKGKNRFGASFSHPISSSPTAMVLAAQPKPNTEDSHGKSVAPTPAVPRVKSLSIPKVSEAGTSCDVS